MIYSALLHGSVFPLSSRDLFTGSRKTYKNLFLHVYFIEYFLLDTVDKPRYDTERVFSIHATMPIYTGNAPKTK
ncbi:MAG TPA: palindromic element RPE4 domain-containing protein [Rickettsia endosymbiont of Pyrocoelia pectoralis]|nr:palindromic element RPE4 domain-containing protein [Rickettsia endosymbiont of Pyrocoelia pectoralis]